MQKLLTKLTLASMLFAPALIPTQLLSQNKIPDNAVFIPVLDLKLTPSGFSYQSLQVKASPFHLVVRNRTGLKNLALVLGSASSANVWQKSFVDGTAGLLDRFDLPNGIYTLSEKSHPEWTIKIEVAK